MWKEWEQKGTRFQSRIYGRNGSRKGLDFSPRNVEGMGAERDYISVQKQWKER